MKMTTLCYIQKDDRYLMLHRNVKRNDENKGKWIGIGGKFLDKESPEDCVKREVLEETGLKIIKPAFRGLITFVSDTMKTEYMHLFTADQYTGTLTPCDEGTLEWVPKVKVPTLTLWEGDRIFLELLDSEEEFFSLKLVYEEESLITAILNGDHILF